MSMQWQTINLINFKYFHRYRMKKVNVPKTYPIVCLKNIWEELADAGIATNLLPPGDIRNTISIRYDMKTISLFGDDG